jgi:hypothetical protein
MKLTFWNQRPGDEAIIAALKVSPTAEFMSVARGDPASPSLPSSRERRAPAPSGLIAHGTLGSEATYVQPKQVGIIRRFQFRICSLR